MPDLILASTSPYRKRLLNRLAVSFRVVDPNVNESTWKDKISSADELTIALARAKARSVAEQEPAAVIIGSDQVAALGAELLNKPGSRAANIEQLERLAGQSHQLVTAVCVLHGREERTLLDRTFLRMRRLSQDEIEAYVDLDQAFDCAGGYKFEAHGVGLFEDIRCTDATAIEGLPLISLGRTLREFGIQFPQRAAI